MTVHRSTKRIVAAWIIAVLLLAGYNGGVDNPEVGTLVLTVTWVLMVAAFIWATYETTRRRQES